MLHPITYGLWLAMTVVFAGITILSIWSRRNTYVRLWSFIAFLFSLPISALCVFVMLGKPLPLIEGLTAPAGDYSVLGVKMVRDQGIYVFIDTGYYPIYLATPFDNKRASKIQELLDDPEQRDNMRMTVRPFEFSWDNREPPDIYAPPQPKVLPDKPHEQEPQYDGGVDAT